MSKVSCDECDTITLEKCPECKVVPLCATCRAEFGMCQDCGGDDEEGDEDEDDMEEVDE